MSTVSIIVPVYNVDQYLKKNIACIQNQTYNDLEIILVDDGSTDLCGKICDDIKKKDNRIKVIHKQNGGLSSARNAGYKVAAGKYLMYIDSDDTIKPEVVEKCVKAIEENESDLVIYGYEKVDENGKILETCSWGDKNYSNDEMVKHLYESITEMSFGYAWNKLYRKEILDKSGILADDKIIDREDLVYNMEMLPYLRKVTYIDYAGYSYLQRRGSLLHNSNLTRLNGIEYFVKRIDSIDVGDEAVNRKVFNMCVLHYLSDCIIKNVLWNEELSGKEKIKILKEIIQKCPLKEHLYDDGDNGRFLRMLYKTIYTGNSAYFYGYVKLSDWKRKIFCK